LLELFLNIGVTGIERYAIVFRVILIFCFRMAVSFWIGLLSLGRILPLLLISLANVRNRFKQDSQE
jgi:hypothetical protein